MLVTASALRHGWSEEDVRWAVAHAVASFHVRTRQPEAVAGLLHLGPARDGRLMEVVTVFEDDDEEVAIHAMAARTSYRRLLDEGRR